MKNWNLLGGTCGICRSFHLGIRGSNFRPWLAYLWFKLRPHGLTWLFSYPLPARLLYLPAIFAVSMWGQIHLVEHPQSHLLWHTDEKSYATASVTVPVHRSGCKYYYYYFSHTTPSGPWTDYYYFSYTLRPWTDLRCLMKITWRIFWPSWSLGRKTVMTKF